jgi:hypothetical protein
MKEPTNKEILEVILLQTKESAKKQLEFALEMSIFANDQRDFNNAQILLNSQIKGYFESNDKTKQKGLIEQQQLNVKDINTLKNQYKIVMGVSMVLGFISGFFSNWFHK